MPSSEVFRYRDRGDATAAAAATSAQQYRHHHQHHRAGGNNSRGTSSNSSSSVLSPAAHQHGRNRGQLKKLYQQRNPDHDVNGYLTTRKLEQTTIKNREKRVRRQYVLEDGRVIEEGDPEIFVDRVEDTLTREEEHEAADDDDHADVDVADADFGIHVAGGGGGGDGVVQKAPRGGGRSKRGRVNSTELVSPGNVIDDTFTRTVNTHDVKEDVTMTEASRNLGRIPRRAIDRALRENQPISEVIERHRNKMKQRRDGGAMRYEVQQTRSKPKVIYSSKSHKKIVDTEDVHNISRRGEDGKVYTETIKKQQHEVFDDNETPDDENKTSGTESDKMIKDKQKYRHTKKDEFTDFYRVPKHRGAEQCGAQLVANGPHITTEERQMERGEHDWEVLEDKILRNRERMRQRLRGNGCGEPDRADALTKKPLNYHHEEKTRRKETDKWLERHFGSDWSLLTNSNNTATAAGHSRILRHHFTTGPHGGAKAQGQNVRRSMSFSSIPIVYTNPRERAAATAATAGNAQAAAVSGSGNNETETEEETKTVERRKVITTKTTTFSPSGERTVHREVKHIEEPTQRFRTQQRTHRNRQPPHRQYNSTLSLSTPKADFTLRQQPAGNGGAHKSRKSQLCYDDAFCSTQSLNRRDQRRSYHYGDHSHPRPPAAEEDADQHRQYHDHHRHHDHNHHRRHRSAAAEQSMQQGGVGGGVGSGHHGFHGSRREHIVEERYSTNRSESSPPMVRSKRLVPTVERQSRNDGSRVVYRSDSTGRRGDGGEGAGASVPRTPIYITEFTKEKLYPTKSENNLLSSGFSSGFHSRQREEQLGGSGFGFQQRHEESFLKPTDYLGFRSMERHDGTGDSHRVRGRSAESSSVAEERSSDNSSRARARQQHKQQQQKRSHSFVDARGRPPPRHHLFQDDFVYDREERKFVSTSGMKPGHSNLRLDASATLPTRGCQYSQHRARGESEYAAAGREGIEGLRQWHSREIMHQQEQLEPQRFKTIIFLSGS